MKISKEKFNQMLLQQYDAGVSRGREQEKNKKTKELLADEKKSLRKAQIDLLQAVANSLNSMASMLDNMRV